jgi:hypothetical protein
VLDDGLVSRFVLLLKKATAVPLLLHTPAVWSQLPEKKRPNFCIVLFAAGSPCTGKLSHRWHLVKGPSSLD